MHAAESPMPLHPHASTSTPHAGPHYLRPDLIPNFQRKWNMVVPVVFAVAIGIPGFAVWWQQSKLKSS
jgi:hypothetical protein